jgi:hypothetical protein
MAVTVLYYLAGQIQIQGSTTPPTGAQAAVFPTVTCQVNWAIADTQASLTHNFGLGASAPGFYEPEVIGPVFIQGPLGGGTNMPLYTFDWTNTNVLKVNKLGVAGTEGTFMVYIRRPHTIGR